MRSSMQQRRNLSIHEYLSMNLLTSVRDLVHAPKDSAEADCRSMALAYPKAKPQRMAKRQRQSLRGSVCDIKKRPWISI